MKKSAEKLFKLLKEQESSYLNLVRIEQEKQEAVLERNGAMLQKLCDDQLNEMNEIERREERRNSLVQEMAKEKGEGEAVPEKLSTIEKWPEINQDIKESLIKEKQSLQEVIVELDSLVNTTGKMLNDSTDFFKAIIDEISIKADDDYNPAEANKQNSSNGRRTPMFVNADC
ncbi:MAG: hypothetical protein OEZ13_00620 [Spirochaetia bacterium]|nr:hypothetical protein [Spirochaetia bacterium]